MLAVYGAGRGEDDFVSLNTVWRFEETNATNVNVQIVFPFSFEVTRFTTESFVFGLQLLYRISVWTFF